MTLPIASVPVRCRVAKWRPSGQLSGPARPGCISVGIARWPTAPAWCLALAIGSARMHRRQTAGSQIPCQVSGSAHRSAGRKPPASQKPGLAPPMPAAHRVRATGLAGGTHDCFVGVNARLKFMPCPAPQARSSSWPGHATLPGYRQLRPTYPAARRVMHHKSRQPCHRLAAVRSSGRAAARTATAMFRRPGSEHGGAAAA